MLVIRGCCLSFCGCESMGTLAFYNSALQMPQPHRLASPLVRTGRLVSSSEERVLPEQGCRPGQGQAGRRDFLDRLCRPFSRQPRRWTGPRVWERGGLWRRPGAHLSHLSAVGTPGCEASGTLTPPATDGHVWGTETGCRGHAASTATASMPETQARLQLGTGLRSGRASAIPQGSKRAGQHSTVTTLSAPAPGEGFATGRKDTRAEAERCVSPFAFLGLVWCLCWQRRSHGGGAVGHFELRVLRGTNHVVGGSPRPQEGRRSPGSAPPRVAPLATAVDPGEHPVGSARPSQVGRRLGWTPAR